MSVVEYAWVEDPTLRDVAICGDCGSKCEALYCDPPRRGSYLSRMWFCPNCKFFSPRS